MHQVHPLAHESDLAGPVREIAKRLEARIRAEFDLTLAPVDERVFAPGPQADGGGAIWQGTQLELETAWAHVRAIGHRSHHVNAWVSSESRVPHLSVIVATTPAPFLFLDLLPRVDMVEETDYLDSYYVELDRKFRDLRMDSTVTPFVMGSAYLRQAVSPSALCFTAAPNAAVVARMDELVFAITEDWLSALKRAEPVAEADRPGLARRDQKMRNTIARRDPGPTGKGGCVAS